MHLTGSTVGIENADGTDGLLTAFNTSYLQPNLAVLYSRGASWLTPDPSSLSVAPGGGPGRVGRL